MKERRGESFRPMRKGALEDWAENAAAKAAGQKTKQRKWYRFFCGNLDCPTRLAGQLHDVHVGNMEDGVLWLCPDCRKKK